MARYIFVTGGVVSSLGKGLSSASLAYLLKSQGYKVRLRKKVYLTFGILMGSFLIGRTISFFLDNSFGTGTAIAFANELIVFVIAYWRYTKRDFIF